MQRNYGSVNASSDQYRPSQNKSLIQTTCEQKLFDVFETYQSEFICPITQMQLKDPVITEDGHSYQKGAIFKWLINSKKSPKTGLNLASSKTIPNIILKQLIQRYKIFKKQLLHQFIEFFSSTIDSLNRSISSLQNVSHQVQDKFKMISKIFEISRDDKKIFNQNDLKSQFFNLEQQVTSQIKNIFIPPQAQLQKISKEYSNLFNCVQNSKQSMKLSFQSQKNEKSQHNTTSLQWIQRMKKGKSIFNQEQQIRETLLQPYQYLLQKFNFEQQQVTDRYRKDRYSHQIGLWHNREPIIMSVFIKYDWKTLSMLNLTQCQINDKDWKTFVQGSDRIFSRLQTIWIYGNNISDVTLNDLNRFRELKCIQFWHYNGLTNPFTSQTKKNIKQFSSQNPNIYIQYPK